MFNLLLLCIVAIPIVLATSTTVSWYDWLPVVIVGWLIYTEFARVLQGGEPQPLARDFLNVQPKREPDIQLRQNKSKERKARPEAPIGARIYDG